MKVLDEYILMALFVLLLKRVHFLTKLKHSNKLQHRPPVYSTNRRAHSFWSEHQTFKHFFTTSVCLFVCLFYSECLQFPPKNKLKYAALARYILRQSNSGNCRVETNLESVVWIRAAWRHNSARSSSLLRQQKLFKNRNNEKIVYKVNAKGPLSICYARPIFV